MSTSFRYPSNLGPIEDTAENRLKHTLFIVEGSSYPLWCDHSEDSLFPPWDIRKDYRAYPATKWEQVSNGWSVQVGSIGKRPIMVSVNWYYIDGQAVCFYEGTSQLVDHAMIDKWFETHFTGTWDNGTRRASIDSGNFGWCLSAIEEANKAGYTKPAPLKTAKEVDTGFIGVKHRVVKCDGSDHGKGNEGCVCHLIGKMVTPTKRYSCPFVGTASYHIKGHKQRVRRSELGLADVMN